ncbi:MAG: (d)CMP kinase [Gaiellales bacterium]|nr:(d)CMP kinase [Gaiellales bacterium]
MVVTVDGPAGSGKSTIARRVATRLGFTYLDTGAMYRAVTLAALEKGVPLGDGPELGRLASRLQLRLDDAGPAPSGESQSRVFLGPRDVSLEVRSPEVTAAVSEVSAHAAVRSAMTELQRRLAGRGQTVMEGRDTGTVVWPEAEVKVFLTASPEERARRRLLQLKARGLTAEQEQVKREMLRRDAWDSGREVAPLRKAEDAVEIDTSHLTIEQVVERVVVLVKEAKAKGGAV